MFKKLGLLLIDMALEKQLEFDFMKEYDKPQFGTAHLLSLMTAFSVGASVIKTLSPVEFFLHHYQVDNYSYPGSVSTMLGIFAIGMTYKSTIQFFGWFNKSKA